MRNFMRHQKAKKTTQKPKEVQPSPVPATDNKTQPANDLPSSPNETGCHGDIQGVPTKENKWQKIAANWDKFAMVIFTGFLAWYTAGLFRETSNQGRATIDQFIRSHQPFLQISEIQIDSPIVIGKQLSGSYLISNYSETPAKMREQVQDVIFRPNEVPLDSFNFKPFKRILQYVVKGYPVRLKWYSASHVTLEDLVNMKYFDYHAYMGRIILYDNLVTNTARYYKFVVKMLPKRDSIVQELIYNENIDSAEDKEVKNVLKSN